MLNQESMSFYLSLSFFIYLSKELLFVIDQSEFNNEVAFKNTLYKYSLAAAHPSAAHLVI